MNERRDHPHPLAAENDPRVRPMHGAWKLIDQWRTWAKRQEAESKTDTRQREVAMLVSAGCYFNCAEQLEAALQDSYNSHHALLVALRQYGQHTRACHWHLCVCGQTFLHHRRRCDSSSGETMRQACSCGFAAALQLAEEP